METLFDLPSEYKELRASVRALSEKEIAPHAQACLLYTSDAADE